MCPRDSNDIIRYSCGHTIPRGACQNYSFTLRRCFGDDLVGPKVFNFKTMSLKLALDTRCSFCEIGKDLHGDYAFGAKWEDRGRYRI